MYKSLVTIRKDNLSYLIDYQYGTQSMLAGRINYYDLSQPTLSDILRSKRSFHDYEARVIEKNLMLPHLWMDKDFWLKDGWELVEEYRKLTESQQNVFNKVAQFVESKCT